MSHRLVVLGAVGALCCVLAACGSSSSTSTTAASGTSSGTGTTASAGRGAALAACLKQHGVTLPAFRGRPPGSGAPGGGAPGGGAPGGDAPGGGTPGSTPGGGAPPAGSRGGFFGGRTLDAKTQAAFKACGANFGAGGGARFRTLSRAGITKYVTCVRQHGYKLPSPNFSGTGPTFPSSIRTNPKFQTASRACASLLAPPRSPLPETTSTTSTSS